MSGRQHPQEFEVGGVLRRLEKFLRKLAPPELALTPETAALYSLTKIHNLVDQLGVVSISNNNFDTL